MKNKEFLEVFYSQLETMMGAEKQITEALPKLIKLAELPELKDALTKHLDETENQIERIESIFTILDIPLKAKKSIAMEGLLQEGDAMLSNRSKSILTDVIIVTAAQRVEHFEMAVYGALRSHAKHLNLDSQIIDLLQENLDEEGAANKALTKIADGSLFASGINEEAAQASSIKPPK